MLGGRAGGVIKRTREHEKYMRNLGISFRATPRATSCGLNFMRPESFPGAGDGRRT